MRKFLFLDLHHDLLAAVEKEASSAVFPFVLLIMVSINSQLYPIFNHLGYGPLAMPMEDDLNCINWWEKKCLNHVWKHFPGRRS